MVIIDTTNTIEIFISPKYHHYRVVVENIFTNWWTKFSEAEASGDMHCVPSQMQWPHLLCLRWYSMV